MLVLIALWPNFRSRQTNKTSVGVAMTPAHIVFSVVVAVLLLLCCVVTYRKRVRGDGLPSPSATLSVVVQTVLVALIVATSLWVPGRRWAIFLLAGEVALLVGSLGWFLRHSARKPVEGPGSEAS